MNLDGRFGDADISSYLFVEPPACDLHHDLAFARAQRFKSFSNRLLCSLIVEASLIACKADLDGVDQILIAERFRQKLNCASFHRLNRHWNVAIPGDENDGDLNSQCVQLALKIGTALARQSHVQDETRRPLRPV